MSRLDPGRRGLAWVDQVSGRLLVNIAYQHLRPTRHAEDCREKCVADCPLHEFGVALARPVLASEIDVAEREEERMQALARGDFTHLEGAGDEAGQPAQ